MKLCDIIDELQANIVGICEHCINFAHKDVVSGARQLFQWEASLLTATGHNVHEKVGRVQEGGTMMLAIDKVTQYKKTGDTDGDPTGLGRWVSMAFGGHGGHVTRVVTAYNPCYNAQKESGTSYQQHHCYLIRHQQDITCPRRKFWEDFIAQLRTWRSDGERLVICMDANQHIYTSQLGQQLVDPEGLDLVEPVWH